ncbi:MAG: glycoside hydrolase family 88 protein [Planctomycetes bacterium]|nr:glycoside hydrolase family 88 protein [Planctomycetota bacterium]
MISTSILTGDSLRQRLERAIAFAARQLRATLKTWTPDRPAPVHTRAGKWYRPRELWTDWTPGFYAGQMWILHQITREPSWRAEAERFSRKLEPRRFDRDVHDLGFIFLSSYGRWHDLLEAGDPQKDRVRDILVTAGTVQSFRWNGCGSHGFLYSFNGPQSLFVDILMNVRLLFWAARHGAPAEVHRRALEHCRTTARYLVRKSGSGLGEEDGRVAHEAIFNAESGRGEFRCLSTQQGYSPFTCWARGLAWALYGFAEAFRYSGEEEFLETAERCARYYLKRTPADGVPYWDYGAPQIPNEPKDSSAAAIAACSLRLLAEATRDPALASECRQAAARILETLAGEEYLAEGHAGEEGILLHGVYHRPRGWGVDASTMWGDYFFLEAIEGALNSLPS